jgi:hypothetical protein
LSFSHALRGSGVAAQPGLGDHPGVVALAADVDGHDRKREGRAEVLQKFERLAEHLRSPSGR